MIPVHIFFLFIHLLFTCLLLHYKLHEIMMYVSLVLCWILTVQKYSWTILNPQQVFGSDE